MVTRRHQCGRRIEAARGASIAPASMISSVVVVPPASITRPSSSHHPQPHRQRGGAREGFAGIATDPKWCARRVPSTGSCLRCPPPARAAYRRVWGRSCGGSRRTASSSACGTAARCRLPTRAQARASTFTWLCRQGADDQADHVVGGVLPFQGPIDRGRAVAVLLVPLADDEHGRHGQLACAQQLVDGLPLPPRVVAGMFEHLADHRPPPTIRVPRRAAAGMQSDMHRTRS